METYANPITSRYIAKKPVIIPINITVPLTPKCFFIYSKIFIIMSLIAMNYFHLKAAANICSLLS